MPGHRNWRDPPGVSLPEEIRAHLQASYDLAFTVWLLSCSVATEREFFKLLALVYSTEPVVRRRRGKLRFVRLPLAKPYSFAGVRVLTRIYNVPWEPTQTPDTRQ